MKSVLMRWVFGAAFGLIVSAVGILITTEQAWAASCSGTTIGHGSADCLTVSYSNNRQSVSLTSECSGLGVVTVETKTVNSTDGTVFSLHPLSNSTPLGLSIHNSVAIFSNARCCPTSGICAITDCDTTDGVINDSSHQTHCRHIDDTTGTVTSTGTEITNGVVTYTPPSDGGS